MEEDLKKINLKKWKTTSKNKTKNGRRPQKIMEDDLKKIKNGRRPQAQLKKSTLIGCDIIVN